MSATATTVKTQVKRISLESVTTGRVDKPIAAVWVGQAGAGKTTGAAGIPGVIVFPIEDGCNQQEVARFPVPESFAEVRDGLLELANKPHDFKALAVDGIDSLEALIWRHVCEKGNKSDIESFGYGKGYVAALDEWRLFLSMCDDLRRKRGMHILLIGHTVIKPFNDPSLTEPYDRFEMRLHKGAAGLLSQWSDVVGFAVHDDVVQAGARKAVGTGNRILRVHHTPAMDAKNRFGITADLELSWAALMEAIHANSPGAAAAMRAEIEALIPKLPEAKREAAVAFLATSPSVSKLKAALAATIEYATTATKEK